MRDVKKSKKLKIIYINAEKLKKNELNPRRLSDPAGVEKLANLIKKHGFQNPLNVYKEKDGTYTILCGNHRFEAGLRLGMTKFPCIVYTGDRKEALARAISDNKSHEWTEWDIAILKDVIENYKLDIDLTGFEQSEIDKLLKTPLSTEEEKKPEYPIAPRLHEYYDYLMIMVKSDMDWQFLKDFFKLEMGRPIYSKRLVGLIRVITFEHFYKHLMDFAKKKQ